MHTFSIFIRKSVNWGGRIKRLNVLLVMAVVLATLPASAASVPNARIQSVLAQLASQQPDRPVNVIVQKSVKDDRVELAVEALGGTITKDLPIINAFAARLNAGDVERLAVSGGVRWVSLDAPVEQVGKPAPPPPLPTTNTYLDTLNVRAAWNLGLNGDGITVAVIDSGISLDKDFSLSSSASGGTRLIKQFSLSPLSATVNDVYGHGTHVAGIVAGNGSDSAGEITGIAPVAKLISLKICDETGRAYESDMVAAMQWIYNNRVTYNIRVVNLSVNSTVAQSYHTSPVDAAAEILWFNQVVVVASAGNYSIGVTLNPIQAAPANDPFIITVGASDERGTASLIDDVTAAYSAYGTTTDGFLKPDIIAPGMNIISVLSKNSSWSTLYPDRVLLNGEYFRLSGTSMAAPMVTGAVALLLQDEPNLTPDQVKYRLKAASNTIAGVSTDIDPATRKVRKYPYLNVYTAATGTTTQSANTGVAASQLLWTGTDPVAWDSVQWGSVQWGSVQWGSVQWGSVQWGSVQWGSDYWGP